MTVDYRTVRGLAESLAIDQAKVLHWIHTGQLEAIDVSETPGGRPRWRIPAEAWERFCRARSNQANTATQQPAKRRRRRRDAKIIEFY
jgi:hypothetical protein